METAIAYIRVSDPKQVVDGNSLVTQEIQVKSLAEQRGYSFLRLFVEPGESAKTDDRPVLQQMLRFCRERRHKVDVLIVPKIDRLARNAYDYAGLKLQLNGLGIRLESVGERIEDNPVGRFTETILASVAQFDNEVRAERSRNGMVQAIREGRWIFVAPYGYQNIRQKGKATIEPQPDESAVVIDIFSRLAAGARPTDVLQHLRRQGRSFTRSHFFKIIRNPAYIGWMRAFGETVRAVPPFVPLVSEAMFAAAQAAIRPKPGPKVYDRDNPAFPLRGTIRCSCGRFLTAGWSSGRTGRYAFYRCLYCPKVNLRRDDVHRFFCFELRKLTLLPSVAQRLREQLETFAQSSQAEYEAERASIVGQTDKAQQLRKAIATKNALGVIPDDLAREQLGELDEQLRALELRRNRSLPPVGELNQALEFAVQFLADLPAQWTAALITSQKRLQRFTFPSGLTYVADDRFRTARNRRLAGSRILSQPKLSSVVHRRSQNPSLLRTRGRRMTLKERYRLVLEVYRLFGPRALPHDLKPLPPAK